MLALILFSIDDHLQAIKYIHNNIYEKFDEAKVQLSISQEKVFSINKADRFD